MITSILVGLLYLAELSVILPLHLIVLMILLREKEFNGLIAYRIMTQMSVCECVQMIGYLLGCIMSLCQSTIHPYVGMIGGCILNAGWTGVVLFVFLLTLNRFIVFSEVKLRAAAQKTLFNVLFSVTWMVCCSVFGIHLIPRFNQEYALSKNTYWFVDKVAATVVSYGEYVFIFVTLTTTLALCLCTVVIIIIKRNLFSEKFKIASGEIKLFVQAFIIFAYMTAIRCVWQYLGPLLSGDFAFTALGMATIAVDGINPLLYIILNRSIRSHFMRMFGFQKTTVVELSSNNKTNNSQ
ncbi:hypothetical protein QR680_010157 [Steinernema hermaphroditum]|uniref:7TM GPCR serpentine receptor class x (Srx) domain-containing protein n=1 Tax=Steinernema hermaphroditum TaxID=289476 RepID=A0AA39IPB7_9BILA|nr:hypothetical protein QR680_010157 [Steinernema hermaphroditum]